MPVTADKPAPYATAGSVLGLISRYRDRGLPTPVNSDVLGRAGIAQTLIPRTLQALKSLDLIDAETGAPTKTFETLRLAPESEYKKRLEEWLKGAYADVFAFVDPSKDGESRIRDAFRGYQPVSQQERMVMLFEGLCVAAGLIPEKSARAAPSPATSQQRSTTRRAAPERAKEAHRYPARSGSSGVPAPLAGLLSSLPPEGEGWTKDARDKFMTTFGTVLDFCFPIVKPEKESGGQKTAA